MNTPTGFLTVDRAGSCNGRHALSFSVNAGRMLGGGKTPANFVPGAFHHHFHDCEVACV